MPTLIFCCKTSILNCFVPRTNMLHLIWRNLSPSHNSRTSSLVWGRAQAREKALGTIKVGNSAISFVQTLALQRFSLIFFSCFQIVENMTDTAFGESLRQKIHDNRTFLNFTYYGDFYSSIGTGGTSSMSVISPDGDAVAATNTINL